MTPASHDEVPAFSLIEFKVNPLPKAYGDAVMLRQVFVNLLSNAAKFSQGSEGVKIELTGELRKTETVYQVRDNGIGFDMAYVGQLFGVFNRLHDGKSFAGTGVGLAIVRRHGGSVSAEGKPGQGAPFSFTLPRI